jgi:hypothetical protein
MKATHRLGIPPELAGKEPEKLDSARADDPQNQPAKHRHIGAVV